MTWDLPIAVEINGKEHKIRNKCDYRVVLDVINALQDEELTMAQRVKCALFIFYEEPIDPQNNEQAIDKMLEIIKSGEETERDAPILMDWNKDFRLIAPPISKVLGYSVRSPEQYTHWQDFVGAYMEIPSECIWATVVTIRAKKQKNKKLEKWEEEFCREHHEWISLPIKFTQEEEEFFSIFEQKGEV